MDKATPSGKTRRKRSRDNKCGHSLNEFSYTGSQMKGP